MRFDLVELYVIGDIDSESYSVFSEELSVLESTYEDGAEVELELSSSGGDTYSMLAFYDRIKTSNLRINITGVGQVSSAAVLVLAAGHTRRLTKNAWVMVHEDTVSTHEYMQTSHIEREARHNRRLEDQWSRVMASITKTSQMVWDDLSRAETYLSANECLKLGLIEEIV